LRKGEKKEKIKFFKNNFKIIALYKQIQDD